MTELILSADVSCLPDRHMVSVMPDLNRRGRVVFDEEAFKAIAKDARTVADRTAALGVNYRTYRRLVTGEIQPGEHVLAAFLARWPDVDPRKVFRWVPERAA